MAKAARVSQAFAWEYKLYSETVFTQEFGSYNAFGLCVCNVRTKTEELRIKDISTDCAFVTQIAEILNNMQVEPAHFAEVVYDFIAEPEQLNQF